MPETQAVSGHLVPLRPGMFEVPDRVNAPVKLLGARCTACGQPFFPRRTFCAACTSGDLRDEAFGETGEVDTFTVVRQQPPGSAMVPPYAIVRVRIDNGPTVQTVAVGDPAAITIGTRVRLVAGRLKEDEAGNTVVSFMAEPLGPART